METPRVASVALLKAWFLAGIQSFGGGAVALALIRQVVVEKHLWVDEAAFNEDLALSQLAPGINQFALALLLGRRIAGARGAAISLVAFVLPSALVTVLLTAAYARIQRSPTARAALRGVIPATIGLGLLTAFQLARASVRDAQAARTVPLSLLVLAASVAAALLHAPTVATLLAGAALCALVYARRKAAP